MALHYSFGVEQPQARRQLRPAKLHLEIDSQASHELHTAIPGLRSALVLFFIFIMHPRDGKEIGGGIR